MYSWISDGSVCSYLETFYSLCFPSSLSPPVLHSSPQSIYAKSHKLMKEAKELSVAGLVDPDLMEDEVSTLEIAFSRFVSQLDERREIIVLAKNFHEKLASVRLHSVFLLIVVHSRGCKISNLKFCDSKIEQCIGVY